MASGTYNVPHNETVSASFTANNYYSVISSDVDLKVIRSGKIVQIDIGVSCDAPYNTYPGIQVASVPPAATQTYVSFPPNLGSDAALRVYVATNGAMYMRWGAAGVGYSVHLTYICQ